MFRSLRRLVNIYIFWCFREINFQFLWNINIPLIWRWTHGIRDGRRWQQDFLWRRGRHQQGGGSWLCPQSQEGEEEESVEDSFLPEKEEEGQEGQRKGLIAGSNNCEIIKDEHETSARVFLQWIKMKSAWFCDITTTTTPSLAQNWTPQCSVLSIRHCSYYTSLPTAEWSI